MEKATLELWLRKCVEPRIKGSPQQIDKDKAELIGEAWQMGLRKEGAEKKLDDYVSRLNTSVLPKEVLDTQTRFGSSKSASEAASVREVLPSHQRKEVSSPDDAHSASGRNSAKSFYRRLVAGGAVTTNLIYLDFKKSASKEGVRNTDEFLREGAPEGAFVLFGSAENQGWVFPNPKLTFISASLEPLFPSLTADQFDHFKEHIEPVQVIRIGKDRWRVLPSDKSDSNRRGGNASTGEPKAPGRTRSAIPSNEHATPAKLKLEQNAKEDTRREAVPKSRLRLAIGIIAILVLVAAALIGTLSKRTPPNGNDKEVPPNMIRIQGSQFQMGNLGGDEYEKPEHTVNVKTFFIDATEVTCQEYQKFVNATSHGIPQTWINGKYPTGADQKPVTGVDWDDANAYARWAKKRLPTEEEWEFAARGTDGRLYPWGSQWHANAANAGDSSAHQLTNVGSYPSGTPSSGLTDMVGNAWEWTASNLAAYPGGRIPQLPNGDFKVIRGGSWKEDSTQATTTYRGYLLARGARDYSATGFRCAKDLTPGQR